MKKVTVVLHVDEEALKQTRVEAGESPEEFDVKFSTAAELGWANDSGISCGEVLAVEPADPNTKYFYRVLKERNGEYEYSHRSTMEIPADKDPSEFLREYISDFYGGHEDSSWEEDGGFYFNGGEVYVCVEDFKEVTKLEYDILKKYIY